MKQEGIISSKRFTFARKHMLQCLCRRYSQLRIKLCQFLQKFNIIYWSKMYMFRLKVDWFIFYSFIIHLFTIQLLLEQKLIKNHPKTENVTEINWLPMKNVSLNQLRSKIKLSLFFNFCLMDVFHKMRQVKLPQWNFPLVVAFNYKQWRNSDIIMENLQILELFQHF